jgi:hypothetical protein
VAVPASSLVVPVTAEVAAAAFFAWKPGVARSMPASPRAVEEARVVGRGGLQGIDHRASGDVLLVRSAKGYIVRLQSLAVELGPYYRVHVVPVAKRKSLDGVHLNRLRGNRGNQNYPVPTTVGLQRPVHRSHLVPGLRRPDRGGHHPLTTRLTKE